MGCIGMAGILGETDGQFAYSEKLLGHKECSG